MVRAAALRHGAGVIAIIRDGDEAKKTGEKVFSPDPSSISGGLGIRRAASAKPTESKGGVWGGNAFSSPILLSPTGT